MVNHEYYPVHTITTIKELIYISAEKFGERTAFQEKIGKDWKNVSFQDFLVMCEALACSLGDKGFKKGDRIAIISKNRIDWCVSYMACALSGITVVPLDRELKEQELYHMLHQSEAKGIICSEDYIDIIFYINKQLPHLKFVISMDEKPRDNVINLNKLVDSGKQLKSKGKTQPLTRDISPDTVVSMLFTSGTTGISKIVPLTHKNITSNIMATCQYVYFNENDKWLSVLPIHHVYECTCGFLIPLYKGAGIAFTENLYKIAENAKEVQPTIMLGVPALYESMLKKIVTTIKSKSLGSFKLSLAFGICKFYQSLRKKNIGYRVFKELHEKFGGKVRLFITGGAAANPEVSKMFQKFGFTFIQGAGMTEISPIYALNPEWYYKHASIGLPLPGEQLTILNPNTNGVGEIAVKGESVFGGYLNAPEVNQECFIDGWFRTGDMGYKDDEGYYFITGRMKNVIVTPGGKNIYPEEIESWLNKSPFILESLVWGGPENNVNEDVHAIIVPDFEYLDQHCRLNNIIKSEEEIKRIIAKEIKTYCSHLSVYKRVKRFQIRNEEFPKTTTKKIKRYLVLSRVLHESEI